MTPHDAANTRATANGAGFAMPPRRPLSPETLAALCAMPTPDERDAARVDAICQRNDAMKMEDVF